jgi:hypothetical protein
MRHSQALLRNRRGLTVLALLLIVIALVVLAIFLFRYLSTGTSA